MELKLRSLAALLTAALYGTTTTAATATPAAPPQLCVNGKCSATPAATTNAIKWHPGHYLESGSFTSASNSQSAGIANEVNILRSGPSQVIGYVMSSYWNTFENTTAGSYNFSLLDSTYVAVTGYQSGQLSSAVYSNPKRFMLWVEHENYFSTTPTDFLPTYLINSSTYGVSPNSGQYGWWTHAGGNGGEAAIWRPAVMSRLIALGQAIASHVLPDGYTMDTSPYVEAVFSMQSETAALPTGDSTFSDSAYTTAFANLDSAMQGYFPHTIVGTINNFGPDTPTTNTITQSGASYLTAGADSDTFGYSSGQVPLSGTLGGLTWGQYAYIGGYGGTDLRGKVPFLASVQSTEVGDVVSYTPTDIFKQVNQTLQATHDLWQFVNWETGSNVQGNYLGTATSISQWNTSPSSYGGMLYVLSQQSLSHTSCPTMLPACNTN